jgi:ATP-dependent DNA ligase
MRFIINPRSRQLANACRPTPLLPKTKAAYVEPMDCLPVSKLPDGPQWLWEIKLDGYRAVAVKSANAVSASKALPAWN